MTIEERDNEILLALHKRFSVSGECRSLSAGTLSVDPTHAVADTAEHQPPPCFIVTVEARNKARENSQAAVKRNAHRKRANAAYRRRQLGAGIAPRAPKPACTDWSQQRNGIQSGKQRLRCANCGRVESAH
jgi:hypothetical protein